MVIKIMVLLELMKKNIVKLEDLFKRNNIKFNEKLNEKYNPSELSARRLVRLFRCQIKEFIVKTKRASYLYLKYSNKDEKYMHICFPGGEHLVKTEDEAIYLYGVYANLDMIQGTKFCQRLQRVYIARGILSPQFFIKIQ